MSSSPQSLLSTEVATYIELVFVFQYLNKAASNIPSYSHL